MSEKPQSREEALEAALQEVQALAKSSIEYLTLFPGTGLCINTLSRVLNVTEPLLSPSRPTSPRKDNDTQLNLFPA